MIPGTVEAVVAEGDGHVGGHGHADEIEGQQVPATDGTSES